jgi:hypothetical protein
MDNKITEETLKRKGHGGPKPRKTKIENGKTLWMCCHCKQYLPIENYSRRADCDRPRSECMECRKETSRLYHYRRVRRFIPTEGDAKEFFIKEDRKKRDINYHLKRMMFNRVKQNSKKRGIKFEIEIEDIEIPKECPILKHKFIPYSFKYGYSLDRIDNNKGYIKGNIRVISRLANIMKSSATDEELKLFSKNIQNYIKK